LTILLGIVFQLGDFYNQNTSNSWFDILNTIIGALIGSGVTIWVLYRTFRQDKKKDETRRVQFQKEKIKYLQSLVKNTISALEKQIENFKTFSDIIKQVPLNIPLLKQVPLNDLDRLVHKINQEEYYHAYLGQFTGTSEIIEEFRKLYGLLDYFHGNLNIMEDSLKRAQDFDYERKLKIKKVVDDVMQDTADYLINPVFAQQTDMLSFINETLNNFYKDRKGEEDLKYFHDNFIQVIMIGLLPYVGTVPQVTQLLRQLKNATFIYSDIQNQNKYLADGFLEQYAVLKTHFTTLKIVAKRLTEYDTTL
jgi:hypothetical protein